MSSTLRERRSRRRLKLPYPVVLYRLGDNAGIQTTTQNINSEGFFCVSEEPFSPNEMLDCKVVIPGQDLGISSKDSLVLRCRAEVVRVVTDGLRPGYGVACRLKTYTVSRQNVDENQEVGQLQEA
jgi:hypothetical protein